MIEGDSYPRSLDKFICRTDVLITDRGKGGTGLFVMISRQLSAEMATLFPAQPLHLLSVLASNHHETAA